MATKLEDLKPYNKTTICPKCYEGDIRTEYHDGETFNCWYFHGHPRFEHFDRVCPNCGYRWAERLAITAINERPSPVQCTGPNDGSGWNQCINCGCCGTSHKGSAAVNCTCDNFVSVAMLQAEKAR